MYLDSYFETAIPVETNLPELDFVTSNELSHYDIIISGLGLKSKANYDEKKEFQVRGLLLEFLETVRPYGRSSWGLLVYQSLTMSAFIIQCDSGTPLPFPFVVKIETPAKKDLSYTPKSDFHLEINTFPHLLLEVNSHSNERDRFRMLLQAACISRIGNSLRTSTLGNPVVIMAIYIDEHYKAHQYLLCQPDLRSTEV
jgi:hypothetical protein